MLSKTGQNQRLDVYDLYDTGKKGKTMGMENRAVVVRDWAGVGTWCVRAGNI